MVNMKTYVVARTKREGIEWCNYHDIKPFAKDTHIITTEASTRGLTIYPHDLLEYLYVPPMEIVTSLGICLKTGGRK